MSPSWILQIRIKTNLPDRDTAADGLLLMWSLLLELYLNIRLVLFDVLARCCGDGGLGLFSYYGHFLLPPM